MNIARYRNQTEVRNLHSMNTSSFSFPDPQQPHAIESPSRAAFSLIIRN